jgi:hypothetical protein
MSGIRYSPKLRARLLAGDLPEWLRLHPRQGYIIAALCARVPWADQAAIKKIYADAKRRGLVVDHVIPLCHPYVCGLTVPENLQGLPHATNAWKGNKWAPDQLQMLPETMQPHQLGLTL